MRYLLCSVAVSFGLQVVFSVSSVVSLFSVLSVYASIGVLLYLLGLGYVGSVVLVMYVSAVGILFLFVLMLLSNRGQTGNSGSPLFFVLTLAFCLLFYLLAFHEYERTDLDLMYVEDFTELESFGRVLYGTYL